MVKAFGVLMAAAGKMMIPGKPMWQVCVDNSCC